MGHCEAIVEPQTSCHVTHRDLQGQMSLLFLFPNFCRRQMPTRTKAKSPGEISGMKKDGKTVAGCLENLLPPAKHSQDEATAPFVSETAGKKDSKCAVCMRILQHLARQNLECCRVESNRILAGDQTCILSIEGGEIKLSRLSQSQS